MENKIEHHIADKTLVIDFYGEIDSVVTPKYRSSLEALLDENSGDVIFNFKHMSFIDSSGIGLILGRYNQLKGDNRKLRISNLNSTAYKLFELSGIFKIMEYVEEEI